MTYACLGNLHALVSCCKTDQLSVDTVEVRSSSLLVPTISFNNLRGSRSFFTEIHLQNRLLVHRPAHGLHGLQHRFLSRHHARHLPCARICRSKIVRRQNASGAWFFLFDRLLAKTQSLGCPVP